MYETESLQMVMEMAKQNGKNEAKAEMLQEKIVQLTDEVKQKDGEISSMAEVISDKNEEIAYLKEQLKQRDEKIEILEQQNGIYNCGANGNVVVNQFFVLSVPKTRTYAGLLNNDGRIKMCHMFQNTMPDGTAPEVFNKVKEITMLQEPQPVVAIKSPGNQVIGNQNNHYHNDEETKDE